MTLTSHLGAVFCVALIATGQVLFKLTAGALSASDTMLSREAVLLGGLAIAIYGIATLFWIVLLQNAPLGRLYPYMALSFVMVAFASWMLFHETITPGYLVGLGLIVGGLVVIATS